MGANLPSVDFNKVQSNAGTVRPSAIVPCIIAPASAGTENQPQQFVRPVDLVTTFQESPLAEYGTYIQDQTHLPVLALRSATSTSPTYGSMITSLAGTAVPAFGSAAAIADDYNVEGNTGLFGFVFTVVAGGALGTAGITYTVSFDGGLSTGPVTALGTATTISPTVPSTGADSGIRLTLGSSTQTYLAGDTISFTTKTSRMTTGDLATSLLALAATKQPWDLLLIHGETSPTFVSQLDTFLAGLEGRGIFNTAFLNTRFKNQASGESEGDYVTALGTLMAGATSIRICVGADGGAVTSVLTGITKSLPTSLAVMGRAETIGVGVDPAETDLGAIGGYDLDNQFSSPIYHDEQIYPGIDALHLTALRTFQGPQAPEGVFINNANLLTSSGDYVYLQHARTMNLACATVFAVLVLLLSKGIRVNPATGFILEAQAAKWESLAQRAANKTIGGQATGVSVSISRVDDISGNGPQTLTVTVQVLPFKYVKTFSVTAEFVNVLS
jgi:hypothetical protein